MTVTVRRVYGIEARSYNPGQPRDADRYNSGQPRDKNGRWSKLSGLVANEGGFTYRPELDDMPASQPRHGVVVAVSGHSRALSADEYAADPEGAITRYEDDMADVMRENPRLHTGAWVDSSTGEVWLDLSEVYSDHDAGVEAGRDRGEIAVWDLDASEEIPTGGTGNRGSTIGDRVPPADGGMGRDDRGAEEGVGRRPGPGDPRGVGPQAADLVLVRRTYARHPKGSSKGGQFASTGTSGQTIGASKPTAVNTTVVGNHPERVIGMAECSPAKLERSAGLYVDNVPGLSHAQTGTAKDGSSKGDPEIVKREMAANVVDVFDRSPAPDTDREWYDAANNVAADLAAEHGVPIESAAGVVASLSPGAPWDDNVPQAEFVMRSIKADRALTAEDIDNINEMRRAKKKEKDRVPTDLKPGQRLSELDDKRAGEALYGMGKSEVNARRLTSDEMVLRGDGRGGYDRVPKFTADGEPYKVRVQSASNLATAVSCYRAGQGDGAPDMDRISDSLGGGHKVRSFYNNIVDPSDPRHVTVDTHACSVAYGYTISQSSRSPYLNVAAAEDAKDPYRQMYKLTAETTTDARTGQAGGYPIVADAYREATAQINARQPPPVPPYTVREVQSITWAQQRRDYPSSGRSGDDFDHLMERQQTLREQYARGEISRGEMLSGIEDARVTWAGNRDTSIEGEE